MRARSRPCSGFHTSPGPPFPRISHYRQLRPCLQPCHLRNDSRDRRLWALDGPPSSSLQAKGRRPSALVAVHRSPASSMQEVSAVTPLRLSDHLLLDDPKPVLLDQLSSSSSSTPKASSSAVRKLINHKIQNENVESAFFVADLGAVVRQHRKWQRLLPRIVSQTPGPMCAPPRGAVGTCREDADPRGEPWRAEGGQSG